MNKKVGIIGGGPAGTLAGILLSNAGVNVTIFDPKQILTTLLPTGGGRCNLTYYEYDNTQFCKNYPRGEKFLLSVFSKFNAMDTISLFNELGIETFIQNDNRVFPTSESSKDVANKLSKILSKNKVKHINQMVIDITNTKGALSIETERNSQSFDYVIIATGGKGNGANLVKKMGHNIIAQKPTLNALKIKENIYYNLAGLSLNNIKITAKHSNKKIGETTGDILFTHNSISGPAIFKISSICAYIDYDFLKPMTLNLCLTNYTEEEIREYIRQTIKENPRKNIKNTMSHLIPKRLTDCILKASNINAEKEITHISKQETNTLINCLTALELTVFGKSNGEEIVTAGGVDLKEINSKTMKSKLIENLYFCGEILDIDGYTGGFNLQNCWSTAFICAEDIIKSAK